MGIYANRVYVRRSWEFETLLAMPSSLSGWYDPQLQYGVVIFPTASQANEAWRSL